MQLLTAEDFTHNFHALEKFARRTRYPRDTDFAEKGEGVLIRRRLVP